MSDNKQLATRAEIDAQRAIAAKAWEEGVRRNTPPVTEPGARQLKVDAQQYAAEMLPYPTVTRPRVVTTPNGAEYRVNNGVIELRCAHSDDTWVQSRALNGGGLQWLASLLTEAQLDEVRRGPCGPTESVEAE